MSDPSDSAGASGGPSRPGDRRLDTPPSQRYIDAARPPDGPDDAEPGTVARGAAIGAIVALFCAAILVVFGVLFLFEAGLVIIALFLGRLTAVGVMSGAGGAGSREIRQALAIAISVGAVALAQVALWLWAGVEGGTLGLFDYLAQTYDIVVPLQLLFAGGAAWLSTK
jgi:hypothetical protein